MWARGCLIHNGPQRKKNEHANISTKKTYLDNSLIERPRSCSLIQETGGSFPETIKSSLEGDLVTCLHSALSSSSLSSSCEPCRMKRWALKFGSVTCNKKWIEKNSILTWSPWLCRKTHTGQEPLHANNMHDWILKNTICRSLDSKLQPCVFGIIAG